MTISIINYGCGNIGDNCIIGPMRLVYEDVPAGTVYIPYRDLIETQKKINAWRLELHS